MKCIKCGAKIETNSDFCSQCGTKVDKLETIQTVVDQEQVKEETSDVEQEPVEEETSDLKQKPIVEQEPIIPENTTKKNKKIVAIIIAIILVITIIVGGFFAIKMFKSPEKATYTENLFTENLVVVSLGDKYGYMDKNGELVIGATFDNARNFENGYAVIETDGKVSLIDNSGKVVVTPNYSGIYSVTEYNSMIVYTIKETTDKDDKNNTKYYYDIIDFDGNKLNDNSFESVAKCGKSYITFEENNKYGLYDLSTNTVIIKPEFDELYGETYDENIICVKVSDKYGFIDKDGKFIINPTYDFVDFCENKNNEIIGYIIRNDKKYGLANLKGEIIVAPTYDHIKSYNDGYYVVELNEKYGVIDKEGKQIINTTYDGVYSSTDTLINEGLIRVSTGNDDDVKYGFIDINNNSVITPQFDHACDFVDGQSIVKTGSNYGVIGVDGKYVINPQYQVLTSEYCNVDDDEDDIDASSYCSNNHDYYIFGKNDKLGIINNKGDVIIEPTYDEIRRIENSTEVYFSVGLEGTYGIINEKDEFIVDQKYKHFYDYYNDGYFVLFDENKKVACVDTTTAIITSGQYDSIGLASKRCSVDGCFGSAEKESGACNTHTCHKSGCNNIVKEGSSFCKDHKSSSSSSSSSYKNYFCKWTGCYNKAEYYGYCWTHIYQIYKYYY